MNKELLFSLYSIHSESGKERKMREFLELQAWERGAWYVDTDRHGNLLITKGDANTFPCVAAHMDQVQHRHPKDFMCMEVGGDVLGYSPKLHEQMGLGADDKNGIYICLECLERFDAIKVAFFVGEETGCTGSSVVDLGFFKDCRFIIEPDRRGGSDLITSMYCGQVCSDEFIDAIGFKDYGYEEDTGTVTDVGALVERGVGISCLNLSCGYYGAHTDHETTCLAELGNCLDFVTHIVETCTDVYPHKYEGHYGYRYGGYSSYCKTKDWDFYGGYGYYDKMSKKEDATEKNKFDDMDGYYCDGFYDEDYQLMSNVLEHDPDITFDEVMYTWGESFWADDKDALRTLYDDARELMGIEDVKDFGGTEEPKDAQDESEVVFETVPCEEMPEQKKGVRIIGTLWNVMKKVS